jgi:hypothetical protein
VGTVYKVNPVGNVQRGSKIELTVYGPLPTVNAPTTAPKLGTVDSPSPLPANEVPAATGSFSVSWSAYSCPSGTSLDTYSIVATNATVQAEPGIGTQATLQATAPGPVTVAYTVTCSGIVSPASPALSLTAVAGSTATPGGTAGTNG